MSKEETQEQERGEQLKVGALARRTGVSIRTLHYYDEIGLLKPALTTRAGHRLYGVAELGRLALIRALGSLGLSLDEIQACFEGPGTLSRDRVESVLELLRARVEADRKVCLRLEALLQTLGEQREVPTEAVRPILEDITMFEKHYTADQLETLRQRADAMGPEAIEESQRTWADLIAEVRSAMDQGVAPESDTARDLAARWDGLIEGFTGGDPGIAASLRKMYQDNPNVAASKGYTPDPAMMEFLEKARSARSS